MNDRDMNNIFYILSQNLDDLKTWWETIDSEDQDYAIEILKMYQEELSNVADLQDEIVVSDLSLAKNYLKKFQL